MIADKTTFLKGTGLMASFILVFVLIFMPLFNNRNGLEYLDDLYNSISKGSAYYIPKLKEKTAVFQSQQVTLQLTFKSQTMAPQAAKLMEESGARVEITGDTLKVSGDLGRILDNCLEDADLMYLNQGDRVRDKYGYDQRRVLFNWWETAGLMDKALKRQKLFQEALTVAEVRKKGVETSYNYYGIEPQRITAKWGVVTFSLIFYVVYTIWYGFAIMFLFEGYGLRLEH
ncbi:MAG: hypothetical protein MI747_07945 [Desulfobacterales bacterium]|nr:hypothetical protein [Desulfobacterales bacterium]